MLSSFFLKVIAPLAGGNDLLQNVLLVAYLLGLIALGWIVYKKTLLDPLEKEAQKK